MRSLESGTMLVTTLAIWAHIEGPSIIRGTRVFVPTCESVTCLPRYPRDDGVALKCSTIKC